MRDPVTKEERDIQIKSAKERMCAKADKAKEKENSTFSGIFDDELGGVWQCRDDGKWGYYCRGLTCPDCAYYDEGRCLANGHVAQKQRDLLIESAKARVKK